MDARRKRAWDGLVSFANGVAADGAELRRIFADCMPWVTAVEPLGLLDMMHDQNLLEEAREYRPLVNVLLRWLASKPKSEERTSLQQQAMSFLHEHTEHIGGVRLKEVCYILDDVEKLNYTQTELEKFKEEHDRYWKGLKNEESPLGIWTPSKDYRDVADPVCDFLLSEYQKYRDKEYSRRDKTPAPPVPIFVCPNCNKLVMPKRAGKKKYCSDCSDRARAEKYREKASPNENRDYQWLYRLKQMGPTLRRVRLRNPKNQERLKEIKARQRDSSRCQSLLLDMGL